MVSKQAMARVFHERLWVKVCILCLVTLLVLWGCATYVLKYYLNHHVLSDMGQYRGSVDSVQIHPLGGFYALEHLEIVRVSSQKNIPFFSVKSLQINLRFSEVIRGNFVFGVELIEPELNFMDAKSDNDKQSGKGGNWLQAARSILPDTLGEIHVSNGAVTFKNLDSKPVVDIQATAIDLSIINLAGDQYSKYGQTAKSSLSGTLLKHGEITATANFHRQNFNDFQLRGTAKSIKLKNLNDLSRVYGNLDFKSGLGDVYMEVTGKNHKVKGYVKPMFSDVDVLSWHQDVEEQGDNLFQFLWEGVAGLLQSVFTNPLSDNLATKIEFEKDIEEMDVDAIGAVWGVVKNAFVESLSEGFE